MIPDIAPARDKVRPLWSVMIPAYNPTRHFDDMLASVLAQAPDAGVMQIEVVDDASSGDVGERVRCIGGGRVGYRRNECNLGLFENWNECIRHARGLLVHILHQDDKVLPGFYRSMEGGLAQCPDAGARFCRHLYMDGNDRWIALSAAEAEAAGELPRCRERFAEGFAVQCPAMVVRRSVYEAVGGFDTRFKYLADLDMWKRIAARYPILWEPETLAVWRQHDAAATMALLSDADKITDAFLLMERSVRYFADLRVANRIFCGKTLSAVRAVSMGLAAAGRLDAVRVILGHLAACSVGRRQSASLLVLLWLRYGLARIWPRTRTMNGPQGGVTP